jgi:DNA topoisomerase-1
MSVTLTTSLALEPKRLARLARLQYVADSEPGYSRMRNGEGFYYSNLRGAKLRDRRQIKRIEQMAIPPAWTDVWICPLPDGHLQATGRDDRGRKQYLYHERWRVVSDQVKFRRLADFARHLPRLRKAIAQDLRAKHLTRKRVLAGMVAVLDLTSIRVGNEEYVRENGSYGLATLRTRHVTLTNAHVELRFRGKGGQIREVTVSHKRLVQLFRELKTLPGAHVFQYLDDEGRVRPATAADVNDYLRETTGQPFTAKDFRTWKASALAAARLHGAGETQSERQRKRILKQVVAEVAESLGNTPTVCRKYYIHADLLDGFLAGSCQLVPVRATKRPGGRSVKTQEQTLARFLRQWLKGHRFKRVNT